MGQRSRPRVKKFYFCCPKSQLQPLEAFTCPHLTLSMQQIVMQGKKCIHKFFFQKKEKTCMKVLPACTFAYYNRSHEMGFQQSYYNDEEEFVTSLIAN